MGQCCQGVVDYGKLGPGSGGNGVTTSNGGTATSNTGTSYSGTQNAGGVTLSISRATKSKTPLSPSAWMIPVLITVTAVLGR